MTVYNNSCEELNILFVDDMQECYHSFRAGLPKKYTSMWTSTKKQALEEIETGEYNLVITDYHLGDKDPEGGEDIIIDAVNREIPVLSISSENKRYEAEICGADDFYFKKEFFNNVEDLINKYARTGRSD